MECQDDTLALSLINMKVLLALVQRAGAIVSRSELFEQVWGNQVVSDDALTRCISDLQQLGRLSEEKLIETLPKRGYRWLAEVVVEAEEAGESAVSVTATSARTLAQQRSRALTASPLLLPVLGLVIIAIVLLMLTSLVIQSRRAPAWVQIALMPIQADAPAYQEIAAELEDALRQALLATDQLRFPSQHAMQSLESTAYAVLLRELDTAWVVEGQVRRLGEGWRLTLSLVDARTSLVIHQQRLTWDGEQAALDAFCGSFTRELKALLGGSP